MATILDVAREAGVSVATVSRVLNNQGVVREATAKRVYGAIEKLAYEPNLLARNFRKSESRVILILAPNFTNPYYARILTGIGDAAAGAGYSALIMNTADDHQRELEAMDMLDKHRADGAICMAVSPKAGWLLPYAQKHMVVQCCEYDPQLSLPYVAIDNAAATWAAMGYLYGLGHRRIAMISSANQYISTKIRRDTYRAFLREKQIGLRAEYLVRSDKVYSAKSGKRAARQLLSLQSRPTAIFCISDTLAFGAVTAAAEMGLRVPQDVSIVGFDDIEYTTMQHPYITTVAQPCYDLGRMAAAKLFARMDKTKPEVERATHLPFRLIERESTAPPCHG